MARVSVVCVCGGGGGELRVLAPIPPAQVCCTTVISDQHSYSFSLHFLSFHPCLGDVKKLREKKKNENCRSSRCQSLVFLLPSPFPILPSPVYRLLSIFFLLPFPFTCLPSPFSRIHSPASRLQFSFSLYTISSILPPASLLPFPISHFLPPIPLLLSRVFFLCITVGTELLIPKNNTASLAAEQVANLC